MGFKIFWWCWTSFSIRRVSNILDLQHVHTYIFNPLTPVANTKLGIEFEHVDMVTIQSVGNLSSIFFILPQQRPVLASAHAPNFFHLKFGNKKNLAGKCKLLIPQDSYNWGRKWNIFIVSTTLWKGFNVNFMYCRCKSGLNHENWSLAQNKNYFFLLQNIY